MKNIYLFSILCVMCIALVSCGNKEKDYQKQYMEACANNDFAKANAIVDMMEVDCKSEDLEKDIRTHRNYVIEKEVLYLVAQGTEESANRLLFLFKENDSFGWDRLLELAISQGNEYLATKIIESGKGINMSTINSACIANMSKLVLLMLPDLVDKMGEVFYTNGIETVEKYLEKNIPEEYTNYLESLLSSQIEGSRIPTGLNEFYSVNIFQYDKGYYGFEEYYNFYKSVVKRNKNCKKVLSTAIRIKNLSLAKKAISFMKENIVITDGSDDEIIRINGVRVRRGSYVQYRPEDINEAKKMLNDAINNGYFN